jgi:hypothetical protein
MLVSPELADVLSAIATRIRRPAALPMVSAYDVHERLWNPPMPLLFQRSIGSENRECERLCGSAVHSTPGRDAYLSHLFQPF